MLIVFPTLAHTTTQHIHSADTDFCKSSINNMSPLFLPLPSPPFCTRSCRKVLIGRKVVLTPRGYRTHLMASEVPLMYGMVAAVVTLEGCEREVGSCEGWEWR